MPSRTPQRSLDPIDRDDETIFEGVPREPTQEGGVLYRSDTQEFRMQDGIGVFNPRDGQLDFVMVSATQGFVYTSSIDGAIYLIGVGVVP